jgi:glycosyltransferase involved in cell wall biosynthesis
MTSTRVAMPAKVYEYIGMGLPLVVAPSGELRDFVKVNKIGLAFKEMNILQITDGIIALEKNRESFSRFQRNVFSIQSTFDRRKQAVHFADLIEKCFKTENAEKSLN